MANRRRKIRAFFGRKRRQVGQVTTRVVQMVPQRIRNSSVVSLGFLKKQILEAALEVAGGITSAGIDEYVDATTTKEDDKFAPYVKAALGLVFKNLNSAGLRHYAIAMSGHNYGEWAKRIARDALTKKLTK